MILPTHLKDWDQNFLHSFKVINNPFQQIAKIWRIPNFSPLLFYCTIRNQSRMTSKTILFQKSPTHSRLFGTYKCLLVNLFTGYFHNTLPPVYLHPLKVFYLFPYQPQLINLTTIITVLLPHIYPPKKKKLVFQNK